MTSTDLFGTDLFVFCSRIENFFFQFSSYRNVRSGLISESN